MPESMRIQQQIDKQVSRNPQDLITKRNSTTTNAPGSSGSPVEHNRLDPAAPSPQRLQIDEGASARARNNPDVESTHPNASGNSYNTIIQGSPSNNATTSSGGLGSTTTTPGASSSSSPSASGSSSGTAGSGTSGSAGGASSGGGSSGGGGH
jgi:hypothetical protein